MTTNIINPIKVLDLLEQIDKAFSERLITLKDIVDQLKFTQVAEFALNEELNKICDQNHNYPSIYLFEILNNNQNAEADVWKNEFKGLWKDPNFPISFVPNIKNARINFHNELSKWIPLYLGKSRRVGTRINEHLMKGLDKPTFAMKLKARKNLHGQFFRVKTIQINVKNYDLIVPQIESAFRNKINPIIGRQ